MADESKSGKDTVDIAGVAVPVTAAPAVDLEKAKAAPAFLAWAAGLDKRFEVRGVHFQSLDMFGPRVGFLKFKADVHLDGHFVPGIVFCRGGAVAILVILTCEGEEYGLLTVQPRVPIGSSAWAEIPAGMLDGDGHFGGVAAKEMKEETGLEISSKDLVDLTELAYGEGKFPGMIPSAGGCDEFMRLFLYRTEVDRAKLDSLQDKCTGCAMEGERICLSVVPLEKLWQVAPDGKTLTALFLYEKLKAAGKL